MESFFGTLLLDRLCSKERKWKKNKLRGELYNIVLLLRSHPIPGFPDWSPLDSEPDKSKKVTPSADWSGQMADKASESNNQGHSGSWSRAKPRKCGRQR